MKQSKVQRMRLLSQIVFFLLLVCMLYFRMLDKWEKEGE